jgi:hypothetical protein
MSTTTSPLK